MASSKRKPKRPIPVKNNIPRLTSNRKNYILEKVSDADNNEFFLKYKTRKERDNLLDSIMGAEAESGSSATDYAEFTRMDISEKEYAIFKATHKGQAFHLKK